MILIKNAKILTMAGVDYDNGSILIDQGKIVKIGEVIDVDKNMYSTSTSDCVPLEQTITGHFMILPVRRNINSGGYGWAIEECLITEVSNPWTGNTYRYKTFCFNGQKYKMTYTSMSGYNITWTINKMV